MKIGHARRRRKNGRRGSEKNGRRRNEKREIVRTEKNVREGNMTSTLREDTRMMMATGGMRGPIAIASGTAIAITLLAIDPLIATEKRRQQIRQRRGMDPGVLSER